jgi:hypothetical protein
MWKKMNIFGYFTMLGILLVLSIVMLQHGIKSHCLLDDMKERRFSVILHWLLFKMISTLLCAQFCASEMSSCCLSDSFTIFPQSEDSISYSSTENV